MCASGLFFFGQSADPVSSVTSHTMQETSDAVEICSSYILKDIYLQCSPSFYEFVIGGVVPRAISATLALRLKNAGLVQFPTEIGKLVYLQALNMADNRLRQLAPNIVQLQHLVILTLDRNHLTVFPIELLSLGALHRLSLADNHIKRVPHNIGTYLAELQTLSLNGNEIETLPSEFCNLSNLQCLELSHNPLFVLPREFGELKSLTEFECDSTNLTVLPISFAYLTALTRLSLKDGNFGCIPDQVFGLTQLRLLDIANAGIARISSRIAVLSELVMLALDGNAIAYLPPEMFQLADLTHLSLASNSMHKLPPEIGSLKQLVYLDVRHNKLETLPQEMSMCTELTKLDCSRNHLKTLPDYLATLTSLRSIDASYNCLQTIPRSLMNSGLTLSLHGNNLIRPVISADGHDNDEQYQSLPNVIYPQYEHELVMPEDADFTLLFRAANIFAPSIAVNIHADAVAARWPYLANVLNSGMYEAQTRQLNLSEYFSIEAGMCFCDLFYGRPIFVGNLVFDDWKSVVDNAAMFQLGNDDLVAFCQAKMVIFNKTKQMN